MSFTFDEINDESVVLRIGETLDFRNAQEFKSLCREQLDDQIANFIFDFEETEILDSTGLGAILYLYRELLPRDGAIAFANVTLPVEVVVQLTRIHNRIDQYPSVEAAVQEITGDDVEMS